MRRLGAGAAPPARGLAATSKVENRNARSTMLEVEPSTPLPVLALASMRLGVNVDALRAEDDDEAGLEPLRDGAHLVRRGRGLAASADVGRGRGAARTRTSGALESRR